MYGTKEIIREAESLPVEERVIIVDALLRTLNPPDLKVDEKWIKEATLRLKELRSGNAKSIPGDHVFEKVMKRYNFRRMPFA